MRTLALVFALAATAARADEVPASLLGEWHAPGCGAAAMTVRPGAYAVRDKNCRITSVTREGDVARVVSDCGTHLMQRLAGGRFLARLDATKPRAEIFARCEAAPKVAGALTCSLGRGEITKVEVACNRTRQVAGRGVTEGYTFANGTTVSVFTTPDGRVTWDGSAARIDPDRPDCVTTGSQWFCVTEG